MISYASEVYPTKIRSRGTGLAAGATKFGGVLILATVAAAIAAPSIKATAIIGAIPLTLAIVALILFGIETKKKQLERITAEELHEALPGLLLGGLVPPPGCIAGRLERGGQYLQQEGLSGMADDLTSMIKRNPIPALLMGVGIGFILARLTSTRS